MLNFKKDLNKRVIALLIWLLFFFNNIALYAMELSKATNLRVPLGEISEKRKSEAAEAISQARGWWFGFQQPKPQARGRWFDFRYPKPKTGLLRHFRARNDGNLDSDDTDGMITSMPKLFKMRLGKMSKDDIGKCLRSLGLDTQNSKRFKNMIVKKLERLREKRPETRDIIREKALELLEIDENNFKEAFMPFIEDYVAIRDAIKKTGIPSDTAKFYNLFDTILTEARKGRLDIRRVVDGTYGPAYIRYSFDIKGNSVTLRNKGDLLIYRALETLPLSGKASEITSPIWKNKENSYYTYPGYNEKPVSKEDIADKAYTYIAQGLVDSSIIMDIPRAISTLKRFIDFCDAPITSKSKIDTIKTCLDILTQYQKDVDQTIMKTELKHVIEAERKPNKIYIDFKRFMDQV